MALSGFKSCQDGGGGRIGENGSSTAPCVWMRNLYLYLYNIYIYIYTIYIYNIYIYYIYRYIISIYYTVYVYIYTYDHATPHDLREIIATPTNIIRNFESLETA